MSTFNLCQLLSNGKVIEIPKIQRDYAEGREIESIEKKRLSMLMDMLDVVTGISSSLSLDFVYGTHNQNRFFPLDGQQRLTTLFLLYWLFGRNDDLKDSRNHSLFIYETRITSEEFCHWLVNQNAADIIEQWKSIVEEKRNINTQNKAQWETYSDENGVVDKIANRLRFPLEKVPSLVDFFMGIDGFKWDWHLDPSIRSMIVVMESACDILNQKGVALNSINNVNLDKITFGVLDNLDCDGDVLFEKMNARGKALSSFDLLKSSLEEELEKQGAAIINDWRREMDGSWIDYCWDVSDIPENPTLQDVEKAEKGLERLLIREIGKSFFQTDFVFTLMGDPDIKSPGQLLQENVCSKYCNWVFDLYQRYARYERGCGNTSFSKLNFQDIYTDLDGLFYTEKDSQGNDVWRDVSWYLQKNGLKWHAENDNTLLNDFVADSLNHDTRVMFYAMMAYLKHVSAKTMAGDSKTGLQPSGLEFENFRDWMRFVRNVFALANRTVRIDKPELVKKACQDVDKWLEKFFADYPTRTASNNMLEFLKDLDSLGQEKNVVDEESLKAKLRMGLLMAGTATASQWESAIYNAENDPHLWGQIIAPLSWSKDNAGNYDLSVFIDYANRLGALFSQPDADLKLIQACLSMQDYHFNGGSDWGSLGTLDTHRDISWKRHMRDKDKVTGVYGIYLKSLIDAWKNPNYTALSCEDFLKSLKFANLQNIPKTDWRYFICNLDCSKLKKLFGIVGTSQRYISFEDSHVYIYRSSSKRVDSVRYELVTLYLNVILEPRQNQKQIGYLGVYHVTSKAGALFEFLHNGDWFAVIPVSDGKYDITKNKQALASNVDILGLEAELKKIGVITNL